MTNRRTAAMVTVAVVAGAIVAGVGLATQSSSRSHKVLQIDEVNGRVGSVVLGETMQNVIGVLGKPEPSVGFGAGNTLSYPHFEIGLRRRRVASILTDDPGASTLRVLRIGDPISAARALYRKAAHCVPNTPDKTAKHPHCTISVPAGRLVVGEDPIRFMQLVRTG
jgi:hypothetical protein